MPITLHHLERSRSTRILWLLEELGLPYELVIHRRSPEQRAPEALKQVHPLGKAPTLVDGDLVMAESSAILRYLNRTYGDSRFSPPFGTPEEARHDEWFDYVEGSAAPFVMVALLGALTGGLPEGMQAIANTELATHFNHISATVAQQRFLMGDRITLADIQMSYTLELAAGVGLLDAYPELQAYLARLKQETGYVAAIARGGPVSLDVAT